MTAGLTDGAVEECRIEWNQRDLAKGSEERDSRRIGIGQIYGRIM